MLARRGSPQFDVVVSTSGTKEKKRKSERRKEKSRDAARCRRSRETEIFHELSEQLPKCLQSMVHLDKASLVRLAIAFLKIRHLFSTYKARLLDKESCTSYDSYYLPSIDGFLLVMSQDGDMIYLSENVHEYLGISQVDLMGHSIFEYSHPCDHEEVRDVLQGRLDGAQDGPFSLFVRMKCALSQKGKNINMRSAAFKVIHCTGRMLSCVSLKPKKGPKEACEQCLVSLGEPVPHPSNIEVPLDRQSFLSRHSPDMKFTYVDKRMTDLLGYKSKDIMGKSVYLYYHACDATTLEKSFRILFAKGQSETGRYRFLAKRGGFVWLLTQATLIYETGSSKPQCVVCVNYVLSGQEKQEEVVSLEQVAACSMPPEPVLLTIQEEKEVQVQDQKQEEKEEEEEELVEEEEQDPCLPQANTTKIFAPRTADMNIGFLTFDGDSNGVLKEEPEDLTHLAPQAGDDSFPLDIPSSFPDLMDDAFLSCSLDQDSGSLDGLHKDTSHFAGAGCSSDTELSPTSGRSLKSPLTNDPFLCLREEEGFSSDYNLSHNHPLFKGPDKLSLVESRKTKDLRGHFDTSSTPCRADNFDVQDDCLADCSAYIPINEEHDFLLNPSSSLLLETNLVPDNQSFVDLEEASPVPVSSVTKSSLTKLLKGDWRGVVNGSKNVVKLSRNDLHSDGSSECPDEYDSDPLESDAKSLRYTKSSKLLVNPNSVFSSSVIKTNGKVGQPQTLCRKQSRIYENSPPEVIDPGEARIRLGSNNNSTNHGMGRHNNNNTNNSVRGDVFRLVESRGVAPVERNPCLLDPPSKRNGPHLLRPLDSPKKMKMDPMLMHSKGAEGSVLLNLLVRGEDASHGYHCQATQNEHPKYKLLPEAAVLDKPLNTQPKLPMSHQADVRSTRRTHSLLL